MFSYYHDKLRGVFDSYFVTNNKIHIDFKRTIYRKCFLQYRGKVVVWDSLRNDLKNKHLRWLPRVSTKVSIRTGKGYKRDPNSVVLHSLFLRFASKFTNIITLIFQFLLLRHRPLSWQQNVLC